MNRSRTFWFILALALIPSTASANAGTPLLWAIVLHMFLGNAVIGLLEGLLLARFWKCARGGAVIIMIAANYVSAWVGAWFLPGGMAPDLTIENFLPRFAGCMAAAFLITLLLEYPFVALALRSGKRALLRAIKATLTVNCASYVLLFGWYAMAAGTSLVTELEVVPPGALLTQNGYRVYYLTPDGGQVRKLTLDSRREPDVISPSSAPRLNDRLILREKSPSQWELRILLEPKRNEEAAAEVEVRELGAVQVAIDQGSTRKKPSEDRGTWFNFGKVPSLGGPSDWEFATGFWPGQGISGKNRKTNATLHYSLETPYALWVVRNATLLPGDFLVFQLGNDQICLLHPASKQIALLARGKGPVVVKEETGALSSPGSGESAPPAGTLPR